MTPSRHPSRPPEVATQRAGERAEASPAGAAQSGEHPKVERPTPEASIVVFDVGSKRYGLPADKVGKVVDREGLAPVPLSPALVLGVMNHLGRIVTVLDGAIALGDEVAAARDADPGHQLLVIDWDGNDVALQVDAIAGVQFLAEAELSESPEPTRVFVERGWAHPQLGLVLVLSLEKLMHKIVEAVGGQSAKG